MFKPEDVDFAKCVVDSIEFPDEFGSYDDCEYEYEQQLMGTISEDFYVMAGVSKLVIVIESLPFVIKIPFDGQNYWDEYEEKYFFTEFGGANERYYSDYCYDELEKTRHLIAYGYGCFVPEMEYIGICNGHCVYIQEKVQPRNECKKINASEESMNRARNSFSTAFSTDWLAKVFDLYGEGFWDHFVEWVRDTDLDIFSDCHAGNYGVDIDGRPVMFDISGFRD